MKSTINKTIYSVLPGSLLAMILLTGCFVAKPYQRPKDLVDDRYYRTDQLPADSTTLADVSWKELFTDDKLTGYINKALEQNLDIRTAIQQIAAAEAYMKQGKANFFPALSAGPSVMYQTNSLNTQLGQLSGGSRLHLVQYGISGNLSWEADVWGKIKSNKEAAVANFLKSQAAHQAVKSDLIAAIADTYYQLMSLDEQKKITGETILYREQNLETTKALKNSGKLTQVAVKQSEALLLNSRSILVSLDNSIKLMENYFCMLLSIPPQPIERNTLDQQQINTALAVGVPVQLLANRPDVKAAEFGYMNAFHLTNAAKAGFYPSLTLSASGGLQSVDFERLFSVSSLFATATGSLLQPVLNKRQIRTQYEVSQANQQIAYNSYKKTILNAAKEVSDALFSYDAQLKLISFKKQEFQEYDSATQYSQELVNNGMGNYLDVITAMTNKLQAELNYVDAKYGKLSAIIQLYKALGGGWK
ncbi:efflux transporter outer membrane subunit [Niabella drilacis]|uniref:Efflux transporter, outer membrane factor (OMF) lipoprotein, NodT family n=1 Tax=Niabella drilacis (strain DSM 25811 / CCM 8410 / CCUG 62505 / LMG 26954 / E90) TaxID=1285928 RepID=A0A1G6VTC2_NIADE|nr:efflux transporter outer membrane subunit [Niabella drilacis]SDD56808.1 efflux transporter, outer membrane factor (OMF) lipoprotein, NodT family [Niabella drilacis]